MRVLLGISLRFAILALSILQYIMLIFTNDLGLLTLGAEYIRILSGCYLCWGVTEVYITCSLKTSKS